MVEKANLSKKIREGLNERGVISMTSVYTAQPMTEADPSVPPAFLVARGPLPSSKTLEENAKLLDEQADLVVGWLTNTLSQGVNDRIAVKMMQRIVTDFIISDQRMRDRLKEFETEVTDL